jgi:PAS domain S-box-containing protein
MAAGKKEGAKKKKTGTGGAPRTLKEEAEAQMARAPKSSAGLDKKTTEELIYELQVHQTELEMQAEELRRAQLALEESRDKYLDLYDFAPLGYLTLTDEALVSQANLTAASLLGVDRSALVHARFRKWIVPEDLEIWDQYFTTLLQSAKKLTLTLLLRRGDKVTFPARLESIRLIGSSRPSIRVAVSDISDIRLAERASRDNVNLLKTVIEHLPVGVMILDERGEITTINQEAERIWGRAPFMSNSQDPPCMLRSLEHGGRIEVNDWAGARAVRKGETTLEEQVEVENPGGIRRILLNSARPLRRSDGSICGAVVVLQDITSGKSAETEIRWLASFPELDPNPVIELDARGTVTFANPAANRILLDLGLPPDPSLFLPQDWQEILQLLKQGTESQVVREITLGSQSFEEIIALERGLQVIRIYARNITERKRAENALGVSEQKLTSLFEMVPVGVSVLDAENRICYANPALDKILGISTESLLRGDYEKRTYLAADGTPLPADQFASTRAVREKRAVHDVENGVVMEDGRIVWVNVSAVPVAISDWRVIIVTADITSRRQAEDALRRSEEFNRNLVKNLPDYVVVCGQEGNILYANPAAGRELGMERGTPGCTSMLTYIPEEEHEGIRTKIRALLAGENVPAREMEISIKDGTKKTVIMKCTPVRFHGTPAILLLLTDITGRKMLEDALKDEARKLSLLSDAFQTANRKLKLLSAITRHDINNQLTVVLGYLSLIRSDTPDDTLPDTLQKITRAAQQISRLIQFTKTYEEVGVSAPVFQDVRMLVKTAARELSGTVRLENKIPHGRNVFADPLIVKVFFNLMDNAVRHGETIARIHFYGKEQDGDYVIFCEDDGIGIPADQKEKIFERGYGTNTGLGLFLAREILSITGITIRETGVPGKGARFEILVPKGMWHREEAEKTS